MQMIQFKMTYENTWVEQVFLEYVGGVYGLCI